MTHSRRWPVPLALLVAGSLLAGCGFGGSDAPAPASSGAAGAALPGAAPSDGADASDPTDGAAQAVGLPDGTTLRVTDSEAGSLPRELISFVSPVLTLTPAGRLPAPAVVQLALDNALPAGTTVLVARRDAAGDPWSWLPARLTSDLRHVEFTSDRLGQVGAVSIDRDAVLDATEESVRSALSARGATAGDADGEAAAALQQACAGGPAARKAGYSLDRAAGAPLTACLGTRQGRTVLTVSNTLAFPVGLAHAGIPVVPGSTSAVPAAWTPWQAALGAGEGAGGARSGPATVLAPGQRASYAVDLAPGGDARLQTTAPPAAAALRVLRATVAALGERLELWGTGSVDVDRTLALLVATPACSRAVAAAEATTVLSDCLSVDRLERVLGDRAALLEPVLTASSLETFLGDRLRATRTRVTGSEQQRLVVRRATPAFTGIAGVWVGPGRTLSVGQDGVATESVRTPDGRPLIDLEYRLTDPTRSGGTSSGRRDAHAGHPDRPGPVLRAATAGGRPRHAARRRGCREAPVPRDDVLRRGAAPGACR